MSRVALLILMLLVMGAVGGFSAGGVMRVWAEGGVQVRDAKIETEADQLRLSFELVNDTSNYARPDVKIVVTDIMGRKLVDIMMRGEISLEAGEVQEIVARWQADSRLVGRLRVEFTVTSEAEETRSVTNFWLIPQSLNLVAMAVSLVATGKVSNWVLTRLA